MSKVTTSPANKFGAWFMHDVYRRNIQYNKNRYNGFSLIDLLFSLVLLSLTLLFAVFMLSRNDRAQLLDNFARQLQIQMSLAHEEAILHNTKFALILENHGYQFYYLPKGKTANWCPIEADPYLYHTFLPNDFLLQLHVDQNNLVDNVFKNMPRVNFNPQGSITPFTLDMGIENKAPVYRITGAVNGMINIVNLSHNPLGFNFN